ncbi:MAG: PilZ domain-containing protein [Phycisphaerae bacterium]|nr:PilZ domain-containing protein [Phycisphaerae bacterium]
MVVSQFQQSDRRLHRRLVIKLPVECRAKTDDREPVLRAVTGNISTGGVFFETELSNGTVPPAPDTMLDLRLLVPPGEGHFPYEGRVQCTARVVRSAELRASEHDGILRRHIGVAARFCEPLRLDF